jgi:cysteinyl-tRNA synthetase
MDDDFNTSGAVAALFELASEANRSHSTEAASLLRALGGLLGILQTDPAQYLQSPSRYQPGSTTLADLTNEQIETLITERATAKKDRNFAEADRLRTQLQNSGIELEDKAGGLTQWRRA